MDDEMLRKNFQIFLKPILKIFMAFSLVKRIICAATVYNEILSLFDTL